SAGGMAVAIAATAVYLLLRPANLNPAGGLGWVIIVVGIAVGGGLWLYTSRTVKMTAMPQLVSLFNAVGGRSAALISIDEYLRLGNYNVAAMFVILAAALIFGVTMTLPIGGADMPVVISLLNSFTGTAVAMAGFVLQNPVLIIAGALVGASGAILTKLMADAMNRSVVNIMVGGFGGGDSVAGPAGAEGASVREVGVDVAAIQLAY